MISMVCPDIEVTMSPGRWALPSGMFSTRPIAPIAFTLALRPASACINPTTQAAPAMSPFMSSMLPAGSMEDMKGDMAGAACVVGLMHALAGRKAKVNAIGAIGLVENMPDGNAQRPGDIVKSMSGQTIEIINTDAEGRLVLADVIWYAAQRFKPKFMVDLATLTGAIIVALGQEFRSEERRVGKECRSR